MVDGLRKLTAVYLVQALLLMGLPMGFSQADPSTFPNLSQQTPFSEGEARALAPAFEWARGGKKLLLDTFQKDRPPQDWQSYFSQSLPQDAHISLVADGVLLTPTRSSKFTFLFKRAAVDASSPQLESIELGDGVVMQAIPRNAAADSSSAPISQSTGDGLLNAVVRHLTQQHVGRYIARFDRVDRYASFEHALARIKLGGTPVDAELFITTPLSKENLMSLIDLDFEVRLFRLRGTGQWVIKKGMKDRVRGLGSFGDYNYKRFLSSFMSYFLYDVDIHNHPSDNISPSPMDIIDMFVGVGPSQWILGRRGMLFIDADYARAARGDHGVALSRLRLSPEREVTMDEVEDQLLIAKEKTTPSDHALLNWDETHYMDRWQKRGVRFEFQPWEPSRGLQAFSMEQLDRRPEGTLDQMIHSPIGKIKFNALKQLFDLAEQGEAAPFLGSFSRDEDSSVRERVTRYVLKSFSIDPDRGRTVLREFTRSPFEPTQAQAFVGFFERSIPDAQTISDFRQWLVSREFSFPESLVISETGARRIAEHTRDLWQGAAESGAFYNRGLNTVEVVILSVLDQGLEVLQTYLQQNVHNHERVRRALQSLTNSVNGGIDILFGYLLDHPELSAGLKIHGLMSVNQAISHSRYRSMVTEIIASIPFEYFHNLFAYSMEIDSIAATRLIVNVFSEHIISDPRVDLMVRVWREENEKGHAEADSPAAIRERYLQQYDETFGNTEFPDHIILSSNDAVGDGARNDNMSRRIVRAMSEDSSAGDGLLDSTLIVARRPGLKLSKEFIPEGSDVVEVVLREPGDEGVTEISEYGYTIWIAHQTWAKEEGVDWNALEETVEQLTGLLPHVLIHPAALDVSGAAPSLELIPESALLHIQADVHLRRVGSRLREAGWSGRQLDMLRALLGGSA